MPVGRSASNFRPRDPIAVQWTDLEVLQEIARYACPSRRFTNDQLLRALATDGVMDDVWEAFEASFRITLQHLPRSTP